MFSYATLKYLHPYLHDVLRIQLIERSKTLKPRCGSTIAISHYSY